MNEEERDTRARLAAAMLTTPNAPTFPEGDAVRQRRPGAVADCHNLWWLTETRTLDVDDQLTWHILNSVRGNWSASKAWYAGSPPPARDGELPPMTAAAENARLRHALCIALDVDPKRSTPTYDLLLRLICRYTAPRRYIIDKSALALSSDDLGALAKFDPSTWVVPLVLEPDPALVALIRQAEWAGTAACCCPWCGRARPHIPIAGIGRKHHGDTCPVASILYPKEKE